MKFLTAVSRTAFALTLTRRSAAFSPSSTQTSSLTTSSPSIHVRSVGRTSSSTQRFMSSSNEPVQIRQIDKEAMVRDCM